MELKVLTLVLGMCLSIIAGLLSIIAWFLKSYADKIDFTFSDHEKRIRAIEKQEVTGSWKFARK